MTSCFWCDSEVLPTGVCSECGHTTKICEGSPDGRKRGNAAFSVPRPSQKIQSKVSMEEKKKWNTPTN
jgi:hypothetical protein